MASALSIIIQNNNVMYKTQQQKGVVLDQLSDFSELSSR